jgi:hypothetical protein
MRISGSEYKGKPRLKFMIAQVEKIPRSYGGTKRPNHINTESSSSLPACSHRFVLLLRTAIVKFAAPAKTQQPCRTIPGSISSKYSGLCNSAAEKDSVEFLEAQLVEEF